MRWLRRPARLLDDAHRRYGDIFTLRLLGMGELVVVSDPELIKEIFTTNPAIAHAGEANQLIRPVVGASSVLLLDERRHMAERKLMLPPFHGNRVRTYGAIIADSVRSAVARWPTGRPVPLQPRMADITLDVIIRAVYGVDDHQRQQALRVAVRRMLDEGTSRLAFQIPQLRRDFGPYRPWRRFLALMADLDRLLYREIASRRLAADLSSRSDILSMLLAAQREDGSALTDTEVRDELVTLLTAGHETTATTLAWAFDQLMHHPKAYGRLVDETLNTDSHAYADAVAQETMRLRPVIPMVVRLLTQPMTLGHHRLPAGSVVSPSIYLTHRRPEIYPDPESFQPERFLDQSPGTYTWLPFGGGVRRCLGASFAQLEMRIVLQEVLRARDVRSPDRKPERIGRRSITFAPPHGARAVLHAR